MLTVYGLKTCDTCRKARKWLEGEGIEYAWVDVRADGVTKDQIAMWVKTAGWEVLLNKASTTWRGLPDAEKEGLTEARAVALMTEHPTLIKRPVFEVGRAVIVGLKPAQAAVETLQG